MEPLYQDRTEAGRDLAVKLAAYANRPDVLVLALPRGGVPVAAEVARALHAPLDVFVVRKLGVPGWEELAMGALASGGVRVLNEETIRAYGIPHDAIEQTAAREQEEIIRQEGIFRGARAAAKIQGRTIILIDDGLATGSTMRAAVAAIRRQAPARIVVGVPVGAPETCAEFQHEADEVICARTPRPFFGVGMWFEDFSQTTDQEVRNLLARSAETSAPSTTSL
ncbi:MAG: phosphoribosyltransferase [Pirellulales bacterium]